jgi:hypothetical protein
MKVLHELLMMRRAPTAEGPLEFYIRTLVLIEGEDPIGLVCGADFTVEDPTWADILTYLAALANQSLWQLMPPQEAYADGAKSELIGVEANSA